MSTTTEPQTTAPRLHTIGAVCERLRAEFNDITISKIRYLEDQGLLQPQDGLEPLDVLVGEEPIAAPGSPRPEQALILEVTDLRDRDVGELLA